ncbi:hypothetical protein GF314_03030, partial [bacterium]|nr:hypothetical protein [bacterium]
MPYHHGMPHPRPRSGSLPMIRRHRCSPLLAVLLLLLLASPLAVQAVTAPALQPLDPDAPDAPSLRAEIRDHGPDGLDLRLELGQIARREVTVAGRAWTALAIDDGAVLGREGRPAMPAWSTLLVVPDGATLTADGVASDHRELADVDLVPLQGEEKSAPVVDAAWYASDQRLDPPLVTMGETARMGGVTVVPVTIQPVGYDPSARTATVATRVDVSLRWRGGRAAAGRVAPAQAAVLADAALNWSEVRDAYVGPEAIPGTWLVVLPFASAQTQVQPLIDWRRRQGYHVVVTDVNQTGASTTAIHAYLQQLYDTVDPPLEFVCLVGDGAGTVDVPTWREQLSGFHGEGDHFYTLLDGNDQLPDVHVGRLSCNNTSQLSIIVDKIVGYETDPPRDDPAWFTRGLAVGDPTDSGITTIYCARWLAEQLYGAGFDRVDQVFGGDFATSMYTSLNAGRSVFGYRGFYGVSGFTVGHASVLENGGRLCFALFPTCESGDWLSTTGRSEVLLRNPDGGAIGAIGTATPGTHTRYNNCFFYGTMDGLINSTDHRQGAALSRGKLELWLNYAAHEPDIPAIWSTWNTLMGDPATDIWLSEPALLDVDHPVAIPTLASALPATVTSSGEPVAGALVAATHGGSWRALGRTDQDGQVLLTLDGVPAGDLALTVTGHGLLPYLGDVAVSDQDHWLDVAAVGLDGDGLASPAELVTMELTVANLGQQAASGVSVTLTSETDWLEVVQPTATVGTIPAGGTAPAAGLQVRLDPRAPHLAHGQLRAVMAGDPGTWTAAVTLEAMGNDVQQEQLTFSAGTLAPGVTTDVVVALHNAGVLPLADGQAVLRSRSLWVEIADSTATFGDLAAGA